MNIVGISQRGPRNIAGAYRFAYNSGNNTGRDTNYWLHFYLGFVYE